MLTPYTLARSMFEELADSAFGNHNSSGLMRTDIRETETRYEVAIDLAGIKKENLTIELKNGNLVISAIVEQDPVPEGEKFDTFAVSASSVPCREASMSAKRFARRTSMQSMKTAPCI